MQRSPTCRTTARQRLLAAAALLLLAATAAFILILLRPQQPATRLPPFEAPAAASVTAGRAPHQAPAATAQRPTAETHNPPVAHAARVLRSPKGLDDDQLADLLEELGRRPFAETEPFYRDFLAATDISTELKIAAIESLGSSGTAAAPLLLSCLDNAAPELRAAAVWALASSDITGIGAQLTEHLQHEQDATVRTRLYQALRDQEDVSPTEVFACVRTEAIPEARLAGFEVLAGANEPAVRDFLAQVAVPELQNTALAATDAHLRLTAVIDLARINSGESRKALEAILQATDDLKVYDAARQALQTPAQPLQDDH